MDPKAILESRSAVLQQVRENEERFELKAERTLHYEDGSTQPVRHPAVGPQPRAGATTW